MTDRVAAELAVRRTLAEYSQTCDDGRFDEFGECFTADAVVVVLGREVRGRTAIREWIANAMPPERRGKHVCVDPIITVEEDRATASSDFMFVARDAGGWRITTAGRYLDELHLDGDRWLLSRREIVLPPRT